jgi:translocation and assembly module TamA
MPSDMEATMRQSGIALIALLTAALLLVPGHTRAAVTPSVKVVVVGVKGALRNNVLASLSLADKARRQKATEDEIRLMHARAEGEIKRALQPFGYYRPLIKSELQTGKSWTARYDIEAGPPMLLDSVRVTVMGEGAKDAKFQKLIQQFPLHKGDVLNHPAYDAGKANFERAAAEGGFLDATFLSSRIEVDLERYTSSIVIDFDSGPRHYFGDVSFDKDILEHGTLVRFVNFRRGDAFDFRRLLELQTDLSGTGYFTKVEVKPAEEPTDHRTVPIDVSLAASRKLRFTGGVGYGTDDGARARVLTEMRRLNRRGHRARTELQYGLRDKRAGIQYFIPWPNPRTDVLTLSSGYQDIRTVTAKSRLTQAGISESRLLGKWRVDPALNYRRENFEVGVDHGIVRTLVPEGTWGRIRADDPLLTRNGDRLRVNARGAHEGALSDVSFLQARLDTKWIKSLGPQSRGLARLELGATQTGDFRRLPPSLRFFAGGTNSVRGYSYNSLGSRDELRHVIGGRYLLATSLELNHFFLPRWGAAVFADAGNATNSLGLNLKKGVGVGARWVSPAGLLRADVAWGLDRARTPIEVHFAMGTEL